jgi:xylan 1,4-beta-xylosidase
MLKKQICQTNKAIFVLLALFGFLMIGHAAPTLKTFQNPVLSVQFEKIGSGDIVLSVKTLPLSCEFFHSSPHGHAKSLGTALTRDLSSEKLTDEKHFDYNFTGVFIGLYATGNGRTNSVPADFDWFEYEAK